jgi:dipeptidyl-peptidase-4
MERWPIVALLALFEVGMTATGAFSEETNPAPQLRPVDAAAAAKLPAPGMVVPGAFGFTPDGKSLTYLKSESTSLTRVLWRIELPEGKPRVVARPPQGGDTDTNVSEAEKLRRERQRLRETGITQAVRAEKADVAVIPLSGDLYIQRADGPLERLTNTPEPELDPKLSADGGKVAFVRNNELYAIDLATKAETQLSHGAVPGVAHGLAEFIAQEEMDRSTGYWWSPDGTTIAYQEFDERHIPLYSIVHQGAEEPTVESHRYPFAGRANAKVRLGVVAAAGGETRWLAVPSFGDDVYLARVDWESPATILVQILSRDQKSLKLNRINIESGEVGLLVEERAETWVNLHNDLRVLKKTGEFVWSSERTGYRHLELRDRDGKLVRVLTSGEWPVDGVLAVDEPRREVWFAAGRESPREAHVYRVSLDGGEPQRITTETGVHRAVVARAGDYFADVFSSRGQPPRSVVRDRAGKVVAVIDDAATDPRVKTTRMTPPELTVFKTRDGVELQGAFYAPGNVKVGERVPLIVMVYGGPHVQRVTESWETTADLTAQYLTERGFAVWKVDNRGSSRRGHAFESALNRNMGDVEVRDQVDGVRFAAASWPVIDPGRVGVTGGSYGGYMTLRALTEAPETFHAGVAIAPVTDWRDYDTCYTERYMGTPAENPTGYRDSSVLTHAAKLKGELLVIHGMLDENVLFRHSARLATALIGASKPFSFLPLPAERHSTRREGDRRFVVERLAEFFDRALRPPKL